jgi:hypothetical protein
MHYNMGNCSNCNMGCNNKCQTSCETTYKTTCNSGFKKMDCDMDNDMGYKNMKPYCPFMNQ